MVAQRSPSLYELLEVSSGATFEEIEQSYQRIASYLGADSLAVYSILDSDNAQQLRTQLDEAYRTLSDPDRRAAYDRARREDYPPITVPVQTSAATSTADAHHVSASAETTSADEGYAADRSDALGEWSKGDVHEKHLPVRGRGQARQTIRGPGPRSGRTPLYGRDVNLQGRDPRSASDVQPREHKPRYGRTVGKQPNEPSREEVSEPQYRKPQYGRWSRREDEDSHHRYELPRGAPVSETPSPTVEGREQVAGPDPRSSDLWAPPSRPLERVETRHSYQSEEVTPPPLPAPPPSPRVESAAPPRVEARPPERTVEPEPRQPEPRQPVMRDAQPPELVKTISDVVEPRQKSNIPAPAALSATAKSKRRVLTPTITVTADTEFNGGVLRNLRESAGASLDELAEMTKVGKRHLIAIEKNDFASLPAAVYTRGFVAEFARAMGLDPAPVAKSFMALYAKHRGAGG